MRACESVRVSECVHACVWVRANVSASECMQTLMGVFMCMYAQVFECDFVRVQVLESESKGECMRE